MFFFLCGIAYSALTGGKELRETPAILTFYFQFIRSSKHHNRSMESDASMTYHRVNKRYHAVSPPEYPTRNGQPMVHSSKSHVTHDPSEIIATVTNGNVFVNHVFQPEEDTDHRSKIDDR